MHNLRGHEREQLALVKLVHNCEAELAQSVAHQTRNQKVAEGLILLCGLMSLWPGEDWREGLILSSEPLFSGQVREGSRPIVGNPTSRATTLKN